MNAKTVENVRGLVHIMTTASSSASTLVSIELIANMSINQLHSAGSLIDGGAEDNKKKCIS